MHDSFFVRFWVRNDLLSSDWINGEFDVESPQQLGNDSPLSSFCKMYTRADTTAGSISVVMFKLIYVSLSAMKDGKLDLSRLSKSGLPA